MSFLHAHLTNPLSVRYLRFMEIIYTKVSQPRWCLKVAAWMVLMIFIHARFISPLMGLKTYLR